LRLLLTTLGGLEEVAALEAGGAGLRASVVAQSLVEAEGDPRAALGLRTVDSVCEILCEAKVGELSLRPLRLALRECFRGLGGEWSGPLRVRGWARAGGLSGRALELVAAREAERVMGVRPSPRGGVVLRVYLLGGGRLLVARQLSPRPLHLRPYYARRHPQALNPLIAAAIPLLAPAGSAYDPCCGSGTIPIEYALARPGAEVAGSDVDPGWVRGARENALRAGAEVELFAADLFLSPAAGGFELVAADPPRELGERSAYRYLEGVAALAARLGARACLVTPYKWAAMRAAERAGLALARDLATYQGGRRVSVLLFEAR